MNYKAVGMKFLKGATSGAVAALGALEVTGHLDGNAWKGIAFAVASGAFHGGWEALKQTAGAPV